MQTDAEIEALRLEVCSWFGLSSLCALLGPGASESESIAHEWLAKAGKRWRPLLSALVCRTLSPARDGKCDQLIRQIAVAVECFHKASLIHDDIEDNDDMRYGEETLHRKYGVPIALNTGDFLLGEGYRLTAGCEVAPVQKDEMFAITARGHRNLALGQGAELCWMRRRMPLEVPQVLDIFRMKTAPAFEIALRLGAVCGGAGAQIHAVLENFSDALGVAYQIRDDFEDYFAAGDSCDLAARRPSLILALALENADSSTRDMLISAWCANEQCDGSFSRVREVIRQMGIQEKATGMLAAHREKALSSLNGLENAELTRVLYAISDKLLDLKTATALC